MIRAFLLVIAVNLTLQAQNPFTSGTFFGSTLPISYKFGAIQSAPNVVDQTVTIVGVDSSCVLFKSFDANSEQSFILLPGEVKKINLYLSLPTLNYPQADRGFSIYSTGNVNVFSSVSEQVSTDSCNIFPFRMFSDSGGMSHVPSGLFTNLLIAPPPSSDSVSGNAPWIVTLKSHFDNNHIVVKPNSDIIVDTILLIPFWPSNGTYDTIINKDECFQMILDNARTTLDSTRPRPNGSIFYSANNLSFDIVISQFKGFHYSCVNTLLLHPTFNNILTRRFFTPQLSRESTDTVFHLPRYQAGCHEEKYDFTSLRHNNRIFVNGTLTRILDSNEIFRFPLSSPSVVTSDFGLLGGVRVMYDSATTNTHLGGWSAIAQGDRFTVNRSQFPTLRNWDTTMRHFALVNIPTSDTTSFRHNGLKTSALFSTYPSDASWGFYKITLDTGVHVMSSDQGFYGMYYNYRQAAYVPADTLNFNFVHSKEVGNFNQCFPLPESIQSQKSDLTFSILYQGQQLLVNPYDTIDLCLSSELQIQTGNQWGNQWSATFGDGLDTMVTTNGVNRLLSHAYAQTGVYAVGLQHSHFCDTLETTFYVNVIDAAIADFIIDTTWECDYIELRLTSTASAASSWFWEVNGQQSYQSSIRIRLTYLDTTLSIKHRTLLAKCADSTLRQLSFSMGSDPIIGLGNVVTPNADEVNDKLCLPEAVRTSSDPCFRWQIFNRWGTSVFKTVQPKDCWEPERSISSGVYYSVINVQGIMYRSSITLTR